MDSHLGEQLMQLAKDKAGDAYVPYSEFPVGAALRTADGAIFTGCNVENASYGLSICAERVAACAAVAAGHREIVAIAVTAPRVASVTPCGACRQFLNEFRPADGELTVFLESRDGPEAVSLADLLPRSFGPRDLD